DEALRDRALLDLLRAEVDRAAEVEQEPRRDLAIFVVLAHVRDLKPRGDIPVDVADIVAVLGLAPVREGEAVTAQERAGIPRPRAVEPPQHRPLEAPQDALGIVPLRVRCLRLWRHGYGAAFPAHARAASRAG